MKTIALGADYKYLNNAETTIKSILWNNDDVKIYLLNFDIPQEWFVRVNQYAKQMGAEIVDAKFNPDLLEDVVVSWHHINLLSYARCLIPMLVPEDKVLYLDSDTIVVHSLNDLFKYDFDDNKLLGVRDFYIEEKFELNTGVILMNNKELKKDPNLTKKLLNLGAEKNLSNGDQTVFNNYFKGEIGELPLEYNDQVGFDLLIGMQDRQDVLDKINSIKNPVIVHYVTADKPFNFLSSVRMREDWWHYHFLEWSEIVNKWANFDRSEIHDPHFDLTTYTLTNTDDIKFIEKLAQKLPDVKFVIGAYTEMSHVLKALLKYPNIQLDQSSTNWRVDHEIKNTDIYLDINDQSGKIDNILNQIDKQGKPILTFENVKTESFDNYYQVFSDDDVDEMIDAISMLADWKKFDEKIRIMNCDQSIAYLLKKRSSVVNLGESEFRLMNGENIAYQDYDPSLARRLKLLMTRGSDKRLAVGLPDIFGNKLSDAFLKYTNLFKDIADKDNFYISTFISRPYIDLADKSKSATYFDKLKELWQDKDILIVEGELTRSGEGNDLFNNAKSIKRIICPSHNAFAKLNEIEDAIRENCQGRLVLLMLGPTAKVVVDDLLDLHQQMIDIGEYEWFKMGVDHKVKLQNKHTAEFNFDQDIDLPDDPEFDAEICARIEK
ncbi:MAG: SP_1767 family glycosyltransferase [Lactobacillus kalixensis]|uniref:SP_1767 family glycosyltransferase n=1 Tax=Lactobacillus kalixensis TaxID=227944 RepID=UPI0039929CF5